MKKFCFNLFAVGVFLSACTPAQQLTTLNYKNYKIENASVDSSYIKMLQPYKDSVGKVMNKVIGFSNTAMYKKQPESALGNYLSDALKTMAEEKFKTKVDAAILNFGGIRAHLPKGNVTIGNIYEIMPFDNYLVLQTLKGDVLLKLLNHTAAKGGWAVSGISMKINANKQAEQILINNQPINVNATYVIANSDYVSMGGDDAAMLKGIPFKNINYLMRDALIEYTQRITNEGKPITAKIENRVYAN